MHRLRLPLCLLLLLVLLGPPAALAMPADACADCAVTVAAPAATPHACDEGTPCTTHESGCMAHCTAALHARAPVLPVPTPGGHAPHHAAVPAPETPPDLPLRPPIVA